MASEIRIYPNGVITTSYPKQSVKDKQEKINENNKAIARAREVLATTKDPKKIARCEEVIKDCTEGNARLRRDMQIITRNPWHDLCTAEWAKREK